MAKKNKKIISVGIIGYGLVGKEEENLLKRIKVSILLLLVM